MRRLHAECDLAGADGAEARPVGEDSEIIMMIPSRVIPSIAKYGFLNQHATLTSQGHHLIASRFATEQELAMARLPYSHKGRELLPKYALLVVKRADFGTFPLPTRYGRVAVVFKKDVMKRATWTYADSLDFSFQAGRFKRGGAANPVLTHGFLYRRKPEDKNACGNYCEAQIWGSLSFEDVDYVMIRDSEPVHASLLKSGLRVYRYAPAARGFARGALVADGGVQSEDSEAPSGPAVSNHLKDRARAAMGDAELAAEIAAAESGADDAAASLERLRLIGELAARPKSAWIVQELRKALNSKDEAIRSSALYGLSELPWKDFRPHLLEGLTDGSPQVNTAAIAFAAEHQDDEEVARLLRGLRDRSPRELLETGDWLDRLTAARLCE